MVVHRRAGKTVACVGDLCLRALKEMKPDGKYAYIGPFRAQAKDVAWTYLKEMTKEVIKGTPRESELRVHLVNGASITIYGADNPDAFRGLYFDGVVIDEYGDCKPNLWREVIVPSLLDRNGWATFIGTPKGKNHFYKVFQRSQSEKGWYSLKLKASESGLLSEEQLAMALAESGEEKYRQEMEVDFDASLPGTYYSKIIQGMEKNGRIGQYPPDPNLPVFVATDLGYSDSCSWWFWQVDQGGPILIDHYENHGQPLEHYFEMLTNKKYDIAKIYLPHDAKAKSFQTGRTTIEQFLMKGLPCELVTRQAVQHGIDAVRMLLPKCRIDQNKCFQGIEALRAYRRRYDEKTDSFANEPVHDWASHSSDAFRYFALVTKASYNPPKPVEVVDDTPKITLDDLWAERDKDWRRKIIRL